MLSCHTPSQAQKQTAAADDDESLYFTSDEMPDPLKWLPAPPDTTSAHFAYDIMQYIWGKNQRLDPVRAAIAKGDADWGMGLIVREFSEPFGLQISREETPEIYKLLDLSIHTADGIARRPKNFYMRKRPFVRMHEPTLTPDDEEYLSGNGSYPSGHTLMGWTTALLLSEINPERADTLLARGLMYGESRVIVGAHWQSDVDAAFLVASAAYAKLHTSERFLAQMRRARNEFRQKTAPAPGK